MKKRQTAEARLRRARIARALRLPHTLDQLSARFGVDRLVVWADLRAIGAVDRLPGDDGDPRYRLRA